MKNISQTILQNLVTNSDFHAKVIPYIKSEYFESMGERKLFEHIFAYSQKYKRLPTFESLFIEMSNDKNITESQAAEIDELVGILKKPSEAIDNIWLVEKTEEYCRERAIINAVMESISIIEGENKKLDRGAIPKMLEEAIGVNFNVSLGHDYFDNAEDRWDYLHRPQEKVPFNLEHFNKVTKGGFSKKTLNLMIAGTHVGKSSMMVHMAAANLRLGKTVVYFTLEMSEEEVSKRVDANLMGMEMDDVEVLPKEVYLKKVGQLRAKHTGKLIVQEYPMSVANINHFKAFLNELKLKKGIVPDVVYVDYLGLMSSIQYKGQSGANSYTILKAVSEELRGLAQEMNLCVVSGAQFNRGGSGNTDPEMDDIADSFGLAFGADFIVAMVATDELIEQDRILIKQLKNRYTDMNRIPSFFVTFKRAKMTFYDYDGRPGASDVAVVDNGKNIDKTMEKQKFGKFNF